MRKLEDYQIAENYSILKACTDCWKAISEFNGFLMAVKDDFSSREVQLLHLCEARNTLEIEGSSMASIRLFEAYASENKLNEPIAALVIEMANMARSFNQTGSLIFHFPFLQKYHPGIDPYLYLRREIRRYLDEPPTIDTLLYLAQLYGYMAVQRKQVKYSFFQANILVNLWLNESGQLQLPILPLSLMYKRNSRRADELLSASFDTGSLQVWIHFFLNMMSQAAKFRLEQLKQIIQLKRSTYEIISKYTIYTLPARTIMDLLFEKPFLKAADLIQHIDCHRQTAYTYLLHLEKLGILIEKKSGREKLYFHKKLFDILIAE